MEGGAAGMTIPLGDLESPADDLVARVAEAAARAAGPDQPPPRGLLLLTKGGHYGNRSGEFSLDVVPSELESALALNAAQGQQHTLPGSIGEASGSARAESSVALLWEVQPNVYKPSKERNREAGKAYRKHRNWHLITTIAAFAWLEQAATEVHVLKGSALALAHEVNADKPVTPEIESFHERTVAAALAALGLRAVELSPEEEDAALLGLIDETFSHGIEGLRLADLVRRVERQGT